MCSFSLRHTEQIEPVSSLLGMCEFGMFTISILSSPVSHADCLYQTTWHLKVTISGIYLVLNSHQVSNLETLKKTDTLKCNGYHKSLLIIFSNDRLSCGEWIWRSNHIATARLQFLRVNDCSLTSRSASLKRHSKPRTETWHPFYSHTHVNTGRWPNSVLMLGQRRRRWANIKAELGQRFLFAGGKYQID